MVESILKSPASFPFVKDLQKKDKSQSVLDSLNNYIISHSKGELSFQAMAGSNIDVQKLIEMEMSTLSTVSIIDDTYIRKNFNKSKAAVLMSNCISEIEQTYPELYYMATFARYMLSDHDRAL